MFRLACFLLLLSALLVPCVGCGKSEAQLRNDLKQVGLAYHNFHDTNQRGPANWDEFLAFAEKTGEPVDSFHRVRDAGYEMKWGVKFGEVSDGLSNTVMAKPPGAGPTLMMDGSVQ